MQFIKRAAVVDSDNELIQVKTFHQNYASKYGSGNGATTADGLAGRFFKLGIVRLRQFPIQRIFRKTAEESVSQFLGNRNRPSTRTDGRKDRDRLPLSLSARVCLPQEGRPLQPLLLLHQEQQVPQVHSLCPRPHHRVRRAGQGI